MLNKLIVMLMIGIFIQGDHVIAGVIGDPEVDHTFNYQGELFNDDSAANGLYDFTIEAYTTDSENNTIGLLFEKTKVSVLDGIFTISDVDLGEITDGFDVYLQVSVRENGVGAPYEELIPRHKINSVPYATQLIAGSAQQDQVLTFNNGEWGPLDLPAISGNTPWVTSGSKINYDAGNVGIGIGVEPHIYRLQVKANDRNTASFDGADNNTVIFKESGNTRGLIGSGFNIEAHDFSVATPVGSTGKIHLAPETNPVLTVTPDGNVGINITDPFADFHVEGTTDGDLFRVRIDGITKLRVRDNGGTAIGVAINPPENGLIVTGDVKQPIVSNGLMKYMVSISNCGNANVSIIKSYNGINDGVITAQNDVTGIGTCEVTFTINVSDRYILATEISGISATGKSVSCAHSGNSISCVVFDAAGNETPGNVDLLIF